MSNEVIAAKLRYQSVDKQKLIDEKCLSLAENIKLFREEANNMSKELKQLNL